MNAAQHSRFQRARDDLHSMITRIGELVRRHQVHRELDDEIRFHVDEETAYNVSLGMSQHAARQKAMADFGGVARYRAETRDARGFAVVDALARDSRLALRRLIRSPTYAVGTITTLGVALGALAALGTLVYHVMLRPLPYDHPEQLVRVSLLTPGIDVSGNAQSPGTFAYMAEAARSFSSIGATMENEGIAITDGDAPERVTGAIITPSIFRVLGTRPALGRLFADDDGVAPNDNAVMISYELWQRRYGGTLDVIGKFIELNRRPRLIVGVVPAHFDYPSKNATVYYADRIEATRASLTDRYLSVVARLRAGVSVTQAQAELNGLFLHIENRFPELAGDIPARRGLRVQVETLQRAIVAPIRSEIFLMEFVIAAMLLIAASNAATLSMVRADRARGEVALARALGANVNAIIRRFVVEGVIVSLAGGVLAIPVAILITATRFGVHDTSIARLDDVAISGAVAACVLGVAALFGACLGILSAARAGASRQGGLGTIGGQSRTTAARGWRRTQETLVAMQIAVAFALLLSAGLIASSLVRMQRVNIGFQPAGGTKFTVHLPFSGYSTYQRAAAFDIATITALRAVPGITDATAVMQVPSTRPALYVRPRVSATRADGSVSTSLVTANIVTGQFFSVMGIPLREGRGFLPGDLGSLTPGVVLGQSLARELFGVESAVGRELHIVSSKKYPTYRVVGVSGDVYGDEIAAGPLRVLYFPLLADLPTTSIETESRIPFLPAGMSFIVRSQLPTSALVRAFRRAVSSIDPRVPIWDVRTLGSVVAESTERARLSMNVLVVAAIATLLLGVIGLYSVIAYAVEGRTREFAVRLAVGASPAMITRLIVLEGGMVTIVGLAAGFALSLITNGLLRDLLFQVSATDPRLYALAGGVLLVSAAIATVWPALRAGSTDPIRALQSGA